MVHKDNNEWVPVLDPTSAVPIYEQVVEQVALAVASGQLVAGDALPSVRALAGAVQINPNTAARALREIERLGLARTLRGVGSVVDDGAKAIARVNARSALSRDVGALVQMALRLGLDDDELVEVVRKTWKEMHREDAD
ncbi:MAG: GntR family transcriptional regulator [Acidobacteriota bacterium]